MDEPVTASGLVVRALSVGAAALAKGALGQAGKDAYEALRNRVRRWAAHDVEQLEASPESANRKAVVAEVIEKQSDDERARLSALAEALVKSLCDQVEAGRPVGVDVGSLKAIEVHLGRISVRTGTGFKATRVDASGTFRIDEIETGVHRPGKH
jgi:hypothetical protein